MLNAGYKKEAITDLKVVNDKYQQVYGNTMKHIVGKQ